MGLVASLASAPVAVEVVKAELVREVRKREDAKYGRYQVGLIEVQSAYLCFSFHAVLFYYII